MIIRYEHIVGGKRLLTNGGQVNPSFSSGYRKSLFFVTNRTICPKADSRSISMVDEKPVQENIWRGLCVLKIDSLRCGLDG
jgi:hypothetical protein